MSKLSNEFHCGDDQCKCLGNRAAAHIEALEQRIAELQQNWERYEWLADRVLACDYGDNDTKGEQIGWRIRHDLLSKNGQRQPAFMYGSSINNAVDAELRKKFAAAQAETDHLLSSPANAAHIAQSMEQVRNGRMQERELIDPDGGDQ